MGNNEQSARAVHEIAEQAAKWLIDLQDISPEQQAAFGRWIRSSPLHMREFFIMRAIKHEFSRVELDDRREREISGARKYRRVVRPISIAAGVLITLVSLLGYLHFSQATEYSTGAGEDRVVMLSDGSRMRLNTRSRVQVQFSPLERKITLLEGEALFTVARNAHRPFRVVTDVATIQAVGTQFNVYRRTDHRTTVSVMEGRVKVFGASEGRDVSEQLNAGDQVDVSERRNIVLRSSGVGGHITQPIWTRGLTKLNGETLEEAAREFNRYNVRQLIVDPRIGRLKMFGVFKPKDLDSFVAAVVMAFELNAKRSYAVSLGTEVVHLEPLTDYQRRSPP